MSGPEPTRATVIAVGALVVSILALAFAGAALMLAVTVVHP